MDKNHLWIISWYKNNPITTSLGYEVVLFDMFRKMY